MTTCADLIAATRRNLLGRERQPMNQLSADISNTVTTVGFTYDLQGIQQGSTLAVGLEEMFVWSVDPTGKTATVQRGYNGSSPLSHVTGDVVAVNPRFSNWEIFAALNNDLVDLTAPSNGLYQVKTLDLTAVSGQIGYDFPTTGFLDMLDIRWQVPGTVTHEWRELADWTISENLPTTTFPSGTALFINGPQPTAQQTIRVRYKAQFTPLANLTDDVATTGLPVTAMDLPPLGAALEIMAGRPIGRADYTTQGDTRRADEVRVSEVVQAPAALRQRRQSRVSNEAARLHAVWADMLRARVRV